jgi:hypothetical protein
MADGRKSLKDILNAWEGQKPPRHGPSEHLQANCWLQFAIHQCGSLSAFSKAFYGDKEDSKLITKWLNESHLPTRSSVLKLQDVAPGGLGLHDSPLWKLLRDRPMGLKEIDRLMAPFRMKPECWWQYWSFPNDDDLRESGRYGGVTNRHDTNGLFQRGDIYGFTAIVAAVRTYEVLGDPLHTGACAYMYRALPSLYKLPWFASQRNLLESCLKAIRARVWMSFMNFDIDWDVINRQSADPEFEPKRELRKRDPVTWRFQQLEDPILFAEWIPGREVKRRKLMREAAAERRKQGAQAPKG